MTHYTDPDYGNERKTNMSAALGIIKAFGWAIVGGAICFAGLWIVNGGNPLS